MKLSDWLAKNNMNPAEFGRALELKYPRNVYRYVGGRLPAPDVVRRIVEFTGGEVSHADFYCEMHDPSISRKSLSNI